MDDDDDDEAQFYHDQIDRFEQGSTILTQLMTQLTVFKSILGTFKETLTFRRLTSTIVDVPHR